MHRLQELFILFIAFILTSCLDSALDATDTYSGNRLVHLEPSANLANFPNDPFKIVGITAQEESWKVIVEYGGGCNEHQFFTWWNGEVSGDSASFIIVHSSHNDLCEALIRDTLSIVIPQVFQGNVNPRTHHLTVINGSSDSRIEINPQLAYLAQGETCAHFTDVENTLCGVGIWDGLWFKLDDEQFSEQEIWLQPVRKASSLQEIRVEEGRYSVGFNVIFGFEYSTPDANCQATPDGIIVPVSVNCISKD